MPPPLPLPAPLPTPPPPAPPASPPPPPRPRPRPPRAAPARPRPRRPRVCPLCASCRRVPACELPLAPAMFKVKAVYDYASPHADDLSFASGQVITVTEEEDADWYVGEYTDDSGVKHDGLFPRNFVERFEPQPPPRPNRASRPPPQEQPAAEPA
ncbi:sh3 domain-containing protein, partial [Stagonosporopsis vannaccii]